jgi:hypothetical protein
VPKASNKKDVNIPNILNNIFFLNITLFSVLRFTNCTNFKDNTGRTQGIKFKINPPIKAIMKISKPNDILFSLNFNICSVCSFGDLVIIFS